MPSSTASRSFRSNKESARSNASTTSTSEAPCDGSLVRVRVGMSTSDPNSPAVSTMSIESHGNNSPGLRSDISPSCMKSNL